MSEMTVKEYMETKKRMTDNCNIRCSDCNLATVKNGTEYGCTMIEYLDCERAIAIVQKWGDEHPVKTLMDKFFEVFPDASKDEDGLPKSFCPRRIGYKDLGCGRSSDDCVECWSQPYIEKK